MKKALITFVLVFIPGIISFAQESKIAFGYGAEMNINTEYGVGGGATLSFDVNMLQQLATGARISLNGDPHYNGILELAVMGRWYFSSFHKGFFMQGNLGLSMISLKDKYSFCEILAGVHGGYRLPFKEFFYVEPYLRVGYPFIFGIGVVAGIRR